MDSPDGADLCFPQLLNTSCTKQWMHPAEGPILYIFLSGLLFLTVTLNLLVIISISHFRELHTSTNLLLISLAVSDFLVGLQLMTVQVSGCWFLGSLICSLILYFTLILTSVSVGNMVLISVDRYIAICDPLCYHARVTTKRVQVSVCLCWASSLLYNGMILKVFLKDRETNDSCFGECMFAVNFTIGAVDIVLTFLGPIAVIVVLYMKVFVVAVSQARAMKSHIACVTRQGSVRVTARKSERKAARTLGIIVAVFLICFGPYYYISLTVQDMLPNNAISLFGLFLLHVNSCINPVIYALFYPWFRKSIKLTLTLQILQPNSRDTHIL